MMLSITSRFIMPFRLIFALTLAVVIAMISWPDADAFAASDTPRGVKTRQHRTVARKPAHAVRARPDSCTQFGPGFVRMAGSDTCIQIGGAVDVGGGVGLGR